MQLILNLGKIFKIKMAREDYVMRNFKAGKLAALIRYDEKTPLNIKMIEIYEGKLHYCLFNAPGLRSIPLEDIKEIKKIKKLAPSKNAK